MRLHLVVLELTLFSCRSAVQEKGFGWGLGSWGGEASSAVTTTLNGALLDDTAGTGGSGTSIF